MKKWHLWLAVSIGLVVIVGMLIREFDVEVLSRIDLSPRFFLGVLMGVLLFAVQMCIRDRCNHQADIHDRYCANHRRPASCAGAKWLRRSADIRCV